MMHRYEARQTECHQSQIFQLFRSMYCSGISTQKRTFIRKFDLPSIGEIIICKKNLNSKRIGKFRLDFGESKGMYKMINNFVDRENAELKTFRSK